MVRGERLAVTAAVATGAFGMITPAYAQSVTYQTFNQQAASPPGGVYIGGDTSPQFDFKLENGSDPNGNPTQTRFFSPNGNSGINPAPMSVGTIPSANTQFSSVPVKPDSTTGSDTFYQITFDVNGASQYGYAQFNPAGDTLKGVGYVAAAPEPSTWAELIVGFGLAGTALRRARRTRRKFQPLAA